MSLVVKTLRREGQKTPGTAEIETPFCLGRRINVEYDLPQGHGAHVGYADYDYGTSGRAIGVFEVTDIYLNMLVNPNFTMIELTSRDEKFDKVHPDCKKMLIDEGVVLKRLKSIDEKMVVNGLEKEIIKLVDSPHGDGVVCSIGDNWFYFGGEEAARSTVEEYKRNIPKDVIAKEMCAVLDEFEGEPTFNDEYLYYYSRLCEQLKELDLKGSGEQLFEIEIIVDIEKATGGPLDVTISGNNLLELKADILPTVKKVCQDNGYSSGNVSVEYTITKNKEYFDSEPPSLFRLDSFGEVREAVDGVTDNARVLIYKIDNSKLIKIGEEGYLPGQEQAKTYFDTIPQNEEFEIKILDEKMQDEVAEMLNICVKTKEGILLSVDNRDSEHVAMTAYYLSSKSEAARHFVVSYANTDKESYYDLANKILKYVEESIQSRINKTNEINQKSVDNIISYATRILEKTDNSVVNKNIIETEKEI